jgi:nucleoside-diphosphate-sugar epimerase
MVALLMTGASGFLGSYLYQHLCSPEGQAALRSRLGTTSDTAVPIHGTYHRHVAWPVTPISIK